MARTSLSILLCGALLLAPSAASAQMDEGATYQDSTGLTWSVATLELGLIATAVAIAASDQSSVGAVAGLMVIAAMLASGISAAVTQALDAPVEPAMIFHHGLVGAALFGGLLSFSLRVAGERSDLPQYVGIGGLLLGAAGAVTYSVLRMDRLAHDPQLVEEAHLLSWGPILTAAIVTAVCGALELDDLAPVIGASLGLVMLGASIAAVEVAIAENPPTDPAMTGAPLVAQGFSF